MTKIKNFLWSLRNRIRSLRKKLKLDFNMPGWLKVMLYLAPVMILLSIFTFYPILNAFRLVIYRGYNSADGSITGYTILGNFITVLKEPNFVLPSQGTSSSAMLNTLAIVGIGVPISVVLSLIIAVALSSIKPLKNFFQTILFLPYVTNSIAIGLVFAYMFKSGDNGLVNQILSFFGIQSISWIEVGATYWSAMGVLLFYTIWDSLAFKIMVFLSGIQGIDKQFYQAAAIDSASKGRIFKKITVPLLSPMIFYIVITSIIGAFKTYTSVIAIFGDAGSPAGARFTLKTIIFYIYDYLSVATPGNMSLAAASSIVLFVLILFLTIIQLQISKKRVHY